MLGRDFSAAAYAAQIEFALGPKQAALASGYRVDSEESIPQSFALGGEAYFRAAFTRGSTWERRGPRRCGKPPVVNGRIYHDIEVLLRAKKIAA